MDEARKGFFGALLDLSFTTFVTTRVVKVLYVLTIVLLLIAYAGIAIAIFSGGEEVATLDENGQVTTTDGGGNVGLGIFWLVVLGPLMLFLYTLLYRVFYELIIVVFRIYENTRDQLELTRRSHGRGRGRPAAAGAASVALRDEGGDRGQRLAGRLQVRRMPALQVHALHGTACEGLDRVELGHGAVLVVLALDQQRGHAMSGRTSSIVQSGNAGSSQTSFQP